MKELAVTDSEESEDNTASKEIKPDGGPARPAKPGREGLSPVMREIRNEEERSLKEWLDELGSQGAFKVQLRREKPLTIRDPRTGKEVKTAGFLDTFDHTIDEQFIQGQYGGGTYALKVTRRGENGSYKFERGNHRTIEIAGDPLLDKLPGNGLPPASTPGTGGDNPSMVKAAFDVMQSQLDRASQAQPRGIDPAVQMLFDQMRSDAANRDRELSQLRNDVRSMANQKPAEDPVKDRLLGSLIDGQSGHVTALQLRHEAELRQIKDSAIQDLARIQDRHDRTVSEMRTSHELALASIKASYEREIAAMRSSHEVTVKATEATFAVQVHTLNGEIKRLERDNAELRVDVKELREKKDKPFLEQVKDIQNLREALGVGDEEGDKSTVDKIVEGITNPTVVEAVTGLFNRAPRAVPPAAPVAAAPTRPRVMTASDGNKFIEMPDGQGGRQLIPVKKKPKMVATEDGTEVEVPEIDPAQITLLVGYLTRAFDGGQDPEVVAQSGRTMVPPDILAWIQQNDTANASGVDLFMSKVAKLPGSSSLATQSGRNWLRKVGKALVGG